MFTVYIDDSGTDPKQSIAIASAIIFPALRTASLDKEWATFIAKEGFSSFHASECIARNAKSEFAEWDEQKVTRVTSRIHQITKKYGVKAFSFAVNKADYDEVVPSKIREFGRFHYTWAIRNVISCLDRWAEIAHMTSPFEYVFDWMDKSQKEAKNEIETVMAEAESVNLAHPDRYTHYSFRRRQDIPALQCTDMLAWTCYQFARHKFGGAKLGTIAAHNFQEFEKDTKGNGEWLTAVTITRENLEKWGQNELNDPRSQKRRKEWLEKHLGK